MDAAVLTAPRHACSHPPRGDCHGRALTGHAGACDAVTRAAHAPSRRPHVGRLRREPHRGPCSRLSERFRSVPLACRECAPVRPGSRSRAACPCRDGVSSSARHAAGAVARADRARRTGRRSDVVRVHGRRRNGAQRTLLGLRASHAHRHYARPQLQCFQERVPSPEPGVPHLLRSALRERVHQPCLGSSRRVLPQVHPAGRRRWSCIASQYGRGRRAGWCVVGSSLGTDARVSLTLVRGWPLNHWACGGAHVCTCAVHQRAGATPGRLGQTTARSWPTRSSSSSPSRCGLV